MEFLASLWRISRDHEDETKVTFACDSSQLAQVSSIPAGALLKVTVEIEE